MLSSVSVFEAHTAEVGSLLMVSTPSLQELKHTHTHIHTHTHTHTEDDFQCHTQGDENDRKKLSGSKQQ